MPLNTEKLYILDADHGFDRVPYDDERLIFSSAYRQLKCAERPIEYHTLSQSPALFLVPAVMNLIGEDMLDVFPLTVKNGDVLKRGAYPTVSELETWLDTTLLPVNLDKERELLALDQANGDDLVFYCDGGGCSGCSGGCGSRDVPFPID